MDSIFNKGSVKGKCWYLKPIWNLIIKYIINRERRNNNMNLVEQYDTLLINAESLLNTYEDIVKNR